MQLTGIHHLTAVSADIAGNYRFYTQVLGMRLVKRSVNQDDVSAYHLFYADAVGSPGTDLTFFDWNVPREQRGTGTVVRTHLRVSGNDTLDYWRRHLAGLEIKVGAITTRDGRQVLDFEDPEGQRLTLVDDEGQGDAPVPWGASPVPAGHQIRGLGPIVMSVPDLNSTETVLTEVMRFRRVREYPYPFDGDHTAYVFEMGDGGPGAELHVVVQPDLPRARPGAGGVHHVAFRTPDREEYHGWVQRLNSLGIPNSGAVDRYYFESLYFREPGGILFEIATDGPGFAVDEDPATLGEVIALPPFLEPRREQIVANLKPID
ncbi:ring-cleaving dioxygenase [soil metagenome]